MTAKKQGILAVSLFALIIIIDQIIKIYVKTHFYLHESVEVTSWFYISFIENNGMAFGMELVDKFVLTGFRILCTGFFGWVLAKAIIQRVVSTSFVITVAAILAGAVGNIIDCVFYGQWFTDSYGHIAQWVDKEVGLMPSHPWFEGRVVDMFYFPLIHFEWPASFPVQNEVVNWLGFNFRWPSWLPSSDVPFLFFRPVFNFADACISVGVISLILFFSKELSTTLDKLFGK